MLILRPDIEICNVATHYACRMLIYLPRHDSYQEAPPSTASQRA
jgi:hypothetical protein